MRNSPYSSGLGATTTRGLPPGTAGRFRAKSRTVSIDSWLPVTPDKSKIAEYGPPGAAKWPREAYSSRVAGSVTVPVTVTRRTWCVGSRSITYLIMDRLERLINVGNTLMQNVWGFALPLRPILRTEFPCILTRCVLDEPCRWD